ncbi:ATP-binding cassette domain-containing protein [Cohnella yongneupensis]|uniref:ATP-binding cassette domain-containing protein n=1 Tax=Cohnella yongneupensis TaxID=425006 RepID=A0ABW0R5M8_9BACL
MTLASAAPIVLEGVSVTGSNESGESAIRLEDVSLTLAPGEWLYVVGVNGSGKSTLARLLAGLYTEGATGAVDRGFAGHTVSPIVLQQPQAQLFGETPREEVQFALEWRETPAEEISLFVRGTLERVGLVPFADEPWDRLSGGQLQLAAFAAALAVDAPLLVLDEATAMLDESNRETIAREARRLQRQGVAIVWVTQRLDELEPDSRVAAISEGRVCFYGDARDFMYGRSGDAISPCERAGLRVPYLAALALRLRQQGHLSDPLPMTAEEWRKVLGNVGESERTHTARL